MTFSRTTIKTPEQADAPRSLHELNALAAVGDVLDKPQWWTQWTNEPAMRAQWLVEMEELLLRRSVEQTLAAWPARPAIREYLTQYLEPLALAGAKKDKAIKNLTAHVLFPVPSGLADSTFSEGRCQDPLDLLDDQEYEDSDEDSEEEEEEDEACEGEDDSEDELALDEDGNVVAFDAAVEQARQKLPTGDEDMEDADTDNEEGEDHADDLREHAKKNPFGQIGWYCNMQILQEAVKPLASSQWTQDVLQGPLNVAANPSIPLVVGRTTSFISGVLHGSGDGSSPTLEAIKAHIPHEEREDVLKILLLHCTKIHELVEMTKLDAAAVLDLIVEELALGEDTLSKVTPGMTPQTWLSDSLIPTGLKSKLISEVAVLESQPADRHDWQPHKDKQVLNLINPSLYPCVFGQTTRLPLHQANKSYPSAADQMRSILFLPAKTKTSGPKGLKFQWIPSEVDVDLEEDGGHAAFVTYINNLHPESFASMYTPLGKIFGRLVPLFDRVLWTLEDEARGKLMGDTSRDAVMFFQSKGYTHPCPPALVPLGLFNPGEEAFSLRGGRCQVIVKLTEFHLTPTKPRYAGGAWRVEGTDAEKIIATGVYFFGSDNIKHAGVSFRTLVRPSDSGDEVANGLQYGLGKEETHTQDLGTISALEDRCLVYPNTFQHRMEPFELADNTKAGVLKVLTFFLVDHLDSIPSTAVIPPQQEEWMERAQEPNSKRQRLVDIANLDVKDNDQSRVGMSYEQAQQVRLELLNDAADY
ncbi:hypothetical protein Poli38472_009515 [Pythium oligandrum]|uniref:DUF4246 domain-containing protein n=1 Tax=Pythium oligandrum TaxID=41045 RepID=A0A8K1CH31_PYTOL|nr:hypothetical protein Poli38472_009515 [Pythium oligandrum]|eukprot:TMW62022.1 hypothetical protein Poli38472_009515 [Pythium oligandrum]